MNGIDQGCIGEPWGISTGTEYDFEHEVLVDLPENSSYHEIRISMWDQDFRMMI